MPARFVLTMFLLTPLACAQLDQVSDSPTRANEPSRATEPVISAESGAAPAATDETGQRFVLERGAFAVRQTDVTVRDTIREKDLELRVRVPEPRAGMEAPVAGWPLVVFSHGAGGSRDAFHDLLDFWASHGYASIAPTHADSIQLRRRAGEAGAGRELLTPAGRAKLRRRVDLGGRVADCKFILDHVGDISAAVAKAGGQTFAVDPARFAVAGHSAGAYTAQLCAGVKARARGIGAPGFGQKSIGDARFKAAVVISGQGTTSPLLDDNSWSEVAIPLFVITGSLDASPPNMGSETPETRQHPFTKSRGTKAGGPPAYLLFIEGATHSSFAGKAASSLLGEQPTTDVSQIQDAVAAGTTLFLDAHLGNATDARQVLAGTRMTNVIPGNVRYETK